ALQHEAFDCHHCPIRGYAFYNGQPKECRKCGSLDHIAANCELEICRHCKSKEHGSKDCQLPKKCNLCGAESHRFRDCPHAYSNKTKQQTHGETENVVDFEDLASLVDLVKCSSVFSFLHSEGHDIALLQECNIPYKSNYRPFQDRWKYAHSIWSGDNKNKSSGAVILFRGWYFEIQQVQEVVEIKWYSFSYN
uniref:CCHC-type domain-containing protein n=1 Tax=Sinocyclocheilus anshuiensis TaxID=1608454 RepID=A0A671P7J0_9TELE